MQQVRNCLLYTIMWFMTMQCIRDSSDINNMRPSLRHCKKLLLQPAGTVRPNQKGLWRLLSFTHRFTFSVASVLANSLLRNLRKRKREVDDGPVVVLRREKASFEAKERKRQRLQREEFERKAS